MAAIQGMKAAAGVIAAGAVHAMMAVMVAAMEAETAGAMTGRKSLKSTIWCARAKNSCAC